MAVATMSLPEDYWENFQLQAEDLENLNNHLLEIETPLSPQELLPVLIEGRLQREQEAAERSRSNGGEIYSPKSRYEVGQKVVLPHLGWATSEVKKVRPGRSFDKGEFSVIELEFEDGQRREFAAEYEDHALDEPLPVDETDPLLNPQAVRQAHGKTLAERLEAGLKEDPEFVYIAGRWFPKSLIVEVNVGHLNLAEAVLDVVKGGPLPTSELLGQVDLPEGINQNLAEFSLDLALQEDARFDEVGPAGKVMWFLRRLEPEDVQETPTTLRYASMDYDPSLLTDEMLDFERAVNDELSPHEANAASKVDEVEISLIYPHWRAGSLPLSPIMTQLFPTAYEAPRVRFSFVDGESGERFPGWVVRLERYVYGLRDWYLEHGAMPGSLIHVRRGEKPGEIVISADSHRSAKEWVRTALVGADGGVVFAMLKQEVSTAFDERMMIALPAEIEPLDQAWEQTLKNPPPFEQLVVDTLRELAELNSQHHVHASELYSAVNVFLRCPPGPILALLASRPWFIHVGDLHFRLDEAGNE